LLLLFSAFNVKAQFGTRQDLESKNGYKNIKLGSDISTLKKENLVLDAGSKMDKDSCLTYEYKDSVAYKITPDISLSGIGITCYKNKILSIVLLLNKSDGYEILALFKKAFGWPTQYNQFIDNYLWPSNLVMLTLNFSHKDSYAIYTCNPLQSELDRKKEKRNNKAVSDL
jgi:hypothetical protein